MKCKSCQAEMEEGENICPVCGEEQTDFSVNQKVCPNCNEKVDMDCKYCNRCGWDFGTQSMQKKICPKCGLELEQDAKFCLKCGHDLSGNGKKKKSMLWIVAVLVVVLAVGAGSTAYYMHQKEVKAEQARLEAEQQAEREAEEQRQELIWSYQSKAIDLHDEINKTKSNFEMLSMMFRNSTQMNTGLYGPSFYTSYAEDLCSAEISEERSRKTEVDKLYQELHEIECEEEEVQELKSAIEDCYKSYCDRYDLLVNVNFTPSEFSSKDASSNEDFNAKHDFARKIIKQIKKEKASKNKEENNFGIENERGTEI